eukprot:69652-Amphidinium_carterae.1
MPWGSYGWNVGAYAAATQGSGMSWGSAGWNVGAYAAATQGSDGWDGASGLRAGIPISNGGQSSDSTLKIPASIDEDPIKVEKEPISGNLVDMFEEFDEDSSVEGTVETYYPDPVSMRSRPYPFTQDRPYPHLEKGK